MRARTLPAPTPRTATEILESGKDVVAKPLSDDDIAALAAWFASLKVEVKEP